MREKMESLTKNKTWILVLRLDGKSLVDCKWIYKVKEMSTDKEPLTFKTRLTAKEFTQKQSVDCDENFSHVKYTTIRILLALIAHNDWEVEQIDIKTIFLHGDSDKIIYMFPPEGL